MGRVLKFRAWDKVHRKMLYRVLAGPGDPCSVVYDEERKDWVNFDDACGELHEFTGLFDKNGKEIYEGDIVQYQYGQSKAAPELVQWNQGICGFEPFCEYDRDCDGTPTVESHDQYVIIGNIYEQPELLKNSHE